MPTPMQSSTPATLRSFRTQDIDEQAALLHGWNQTYNQLSRGAFFGALNEAEFGGCYLFREITSNSLYQVGSLADDQIAVGVPLSLLGTARFCGQVCDGTQVHLFTGREGFEFHSPNGLDIIGLVLPAPSLRAVLLGDEQDALTTLLQSARLAHAPARPREQLRRLLTGAFEALFTPGEIAGTPEAGQAFASDLARALAECLSPDFGHDPHAMTEARCWLVVQDAKRLALQSASENLTIEDICRTLQVSRRTLQTCFQTALGIRPATYLRAVRLNAARRTLKECGSVTEAATAWGFWHFGRFAQDYKSMFGEPPSHTVRRHWPSGPRAASPNT